jgi:hypothetical protein
MRPARSACRFHTIRLVTKVDQTFLFQEAGDIGADPLKREGTFLTKISLRYGAAPGAPIGATLTGAGCGVRRSRTMLLKGGCGYEES